MLKKVFSKITGKMTRTEKSGVINMCIKPISMVLSLAHTPLMLAYLGDEKYGVWATLLSIVNWINYFDVGIGNGLRQILPRQLAEKDYGDARRSISTAYTVLTLISVAIYIVLLLSVLLFDWKNVFSTTVEVSPVLCICFTYICINFVLSLVRTIHYSLQRSERNAIRGVISQVITVAGMFVLTLSGSGSLVAVALVHGGASLLVNIADSIDMFSKNKELCPSVKYFDKSKLTIIGGVGVKYLVIQLMCLVLFTTDNLLISNLFGSAAVTPFSIANRVFEIAYSMLAAFLIPYWSRSTVAFQQGDIDWIKNSYRKTMLLCLLFCAGYLVMVPLFKPVVGLWMGRQLAFEPGLPMLMAVFYGLYSIMAVQCQFINGSGKINVQMIMYVVIGAANIPLSIFLGKTMGLGAFGIRLATAILVLIEIVVLAINFRCIVRNAECDAHLAEGQ